MDRATDVRVAKLIMGQEPGQEEIPRYSSDLNAAWNVAQRIQHLPYDGKASLERALRIAWTFEDLIRQTPLLDQPPATAAHLICETALLAIQEERADARAD